MLFVEGQAKAILEELEENNDGAPQNYTNCADTLKSCFYTPAARESKMVEFETRTQQIQETEYEFMLSLLKLYRATNPEHDDNIRDAAIKRKFLQGISPEHRRNARIHLVPTSAPPRTERSPNKAKVLCITNGELTNAINNLTLAMKEHISTTEKKINEHDGLLAIN